MTAANMRSKGYRFKVSCNEACSISGQLTVGKVKTTAVTGQVLATAGYATMTSKLNADAKKLLREDSTQGFGLKVTVTDAAGNKVTASRSGKTK